MIEHKVKVGDYTVVCSGVVVIPAGIKEIAIEFGGLNFTFEFVVDESGPGLYIKGKDKTLLVSVKNYTFENSTSGRGKTNEFMRVGLFNGEALFVSFIIATRKNNSRVLTYTFASQPDTDDRVEGDADE